MKVEGALRRTLRQVLHGCRQLVPCGVGLSPATSATPVLSCHQVMLGTLRRPLRLTERKVGTTSSHHGPYAWGYTRTTMAHTKGSETARWSPSQKTRPSPDRSLQLDSSKSESLVILDQHARVNAFPGLVHTARHTTKVGFTRSR